jgi:hypothetical protein
MPMQPMLETYNDNSTLQATCQTIGNRKLDHMAIAYGESKPTPQLSFVRIADYGCSGGRNSCEPIRVMISRLRERSPSLRAECILEDLPSNPWHLVIEESARISAAFPGDVQILCAGTSFYQQVCADRSVDLAYSYVASHFLSEAPPLRSHVMMHEATPAERAAWEAQAARDWEAFLLLRARELRPGARMMISTMSRDESGYSWKLFSHLVWDSIQQQCGSKGGLSREEAEHLRIPACLRSEAEVLAPFATDGPASSALAVDSLEFCRTEIDGEAARPVGVLAPLLRRRVESVWGGMFLNQLRGLGRSEESAKQVMTEVWDVFEGKISRDTSRGWLDMRSFYLQLTRK